MSVNIEFVKKLVDDIEESVRIIRSYVSKPYEELSDAERYAIRYHLIVIAEALIALALHIVRREFGVRPDTPMHALRVLREKGLVGNEEVRDAINVIKLRNLLVHRYWVVDDRRIYENAVKDFRNILSLVRKVLSYVSGREV